MVDIVANPEWKSVRILERDEVALGGVGGNMNEQATALVARTFDQVRAIDEAEHTKAFGVGGRFYGDTWSDPATLLP